MTRANNLMSPLRYLIAFMTREAAHTLESRIDAEAARQFDVMKVYRVACDVCFVNATVKATDKPGAHDQFKTLGWAKLGDKLHCPACAVKHIEAGGKQ